MNITNSTDIKRKTEVIINSIDNEVVMLNLKNEDFYYFNSLRSAIGNILEKPQMFAKLFSNLLKMYHINRSKCISETKLYLIELNKKDILNLYDR